MALFSFMANKLAIAGRELWKGHPGNAWAALTTKSFTGSELVQPSRYRNGNFFFGVNGADKAFVWGNFNSSLIAYQKCPVVSSVINRKAQAMVNGKRFIADKDGNESASVQAQQLNKLFKRPNPLQSGMAFEAQGNVYKQIYGYCPILVVKPAGFESDYSKWRLWNIPPWMIQVMDNQKWFFESELKPFESIYLNYLGQRTEIPQENIFFLKENQISTGLFMSNSTTENVSMFLPDSKLLSLESNISNFIASVSSRQSLITQRGPMWILTNDNKEDGGGAFPQDTKTIDKVHEDFQRYGMGFGQRKAIITDAALKLQTVGFDVAQLKLLEGEIQDAKAICDGLNFPPYLMGLVDAKYDNQQIAERAFYTNSIIPDSESEDEQWTDFLQLEKFGLQVLTDFSHLPSLQENIESQGRGRAYMNQGLLIEWLNNQLTHGRWRELLGEDVDPNLKDMYYTDMIKAKWVFGSVPNVAINNIPSGNTQNTDNGTAN